MKSPHYKTTSDIVNNLSKTPRLSVSDDDDTPPERPSMPTNYYSKNNSNNTNRSDAEKHKWKGERNKHQPTAYSTHSLPNRSSSSKANTKRTSLDDQTITVSTSSDAGKQEYRLGETINLRVSVRGSKKKMVSSDSKDEGPDDVFDNTDSRKKSVPSYQSHTERQFPKQYDSSSKIPKKNASSNSSSSSPRNRSSKRRDVEEPKSLAERISLYESNPRTSLPSSPDISSNMKKPQYQQQQRSTTAAPPKRLSSARSTALLVEEDVLQEEHVKEDFAMNEADLLNGMDFINTYLSSTPSSSNSVTSAKDHDNAKARKEPLDLSSPDLREVEQQFDHRDPSTRTSATTTVEVPSTRPTSSEPPPRMLLKRQMQTTGSTSSLPSASTSDVENDTNKGFETRSEYDSSEDEANRSSSSAKLTRNRSFRRSIIIEDDEVSVRRKKSIGGTSVSVAFIAINKKKEDTHKEVTTHQRLKGILNFLDNMVLDDESLGLYYDSVRQLHTVFWDLKGKRDSSSHLVNDQESKDGEETLSSALNFLVVHEWPKVMLGCFKKLKAAYPHVFLEEVSPENTVYYSGHLPSLLRMNRTTSEFAVSVIFDGLLRAAVNFTDVHEASRQACCEDNLVEYLMDDIMAQLHNIKWGKATAREMFLKSISDLIYNCAQSFSNASYLLERNCVDVFTRMRDETFHVVDARKVNMTLLLTLSYLIDDNNYDIIIPDEGSIIRVLQFLDKSLEHSEHTHHDFYASELAGCLSRLAGHNSNKTAITRNSGQEILHKLLKYAYDDEERVSACHALWNLSFCGDAKDILRGMFKLMNLLRDFSNSSNVRLQTAAAGVIWECEDKYDIKGTRDIRPASPGHVMISYESEAQPLLIKIRDELNRKGFQVWMKNSNEKHSLEDVMTKGVERASIVIVAVTRQYKLNPATFAEVDYAHTLRKRIVPIIIDVDFVPDGWLKEMIENVQSFDFSRRSMFAGSLDALLEHVKAVCSPSLQANGEVTLNIENGEAKRSDDVITWSNSDVISWLKENELIRSVSNAGRLNKLTGLHLIMFFDLKRESPDYYYSVLDSHLGFKDVLDTLEFTYAMDRLLGNERLI